MAELAPTDVAAFTNGRLSATDSDVADMLASALEMARNHVGWHVSPIRTDTVVLDGPDSRMLYLPTRKLNTLTSIAENGTTLDLSKLSWSTGGVPGIRGAPVRVRKKTNGWWTCNYQGISVVMTHGYTEAEAASWRQAILTIVDQMSLVPVSGGIDASRAGMSQKRVDDVQYRWDPGFSLTSEDVLFSVDNVLDDYALPTVEFI